MLLFVVFLSIRILVASRIAWSSALKLDASLPTAKECDEDVVSGYLMLTHEPTFLVASLAEPDLYITFML